MNPDKDPAFYFDLYAFHEGVAEEFKKVHEQYYSPLYRMLFRYLGNRNDDIEDLLQEIFLALWKFKDKIKDQSHLNNWLYQVCRNKLVDKIKKDKVLQSIIKKEDIAKLQEVKEEAEEEKEKEAQHKKLYSTLDLINKDYKTIIQEIRLNGKTRAEVADSMNIPINSVYTLLSRAIKSLREHWKDS